VTKDNCVSSKITFVPSTIFQGKYERITPVKTLSQTWDKTTLKDITINWGSFHHVGTPSI